MLIYCRLQLTQEYENHQNTSQTPAHAHWASAAVVAPLGLPDKRRSGGGWGKDGVKRLGYPATECTLLVTSPRIHRTLTATSRGHCTGPDSTSATTSLSAWIWRKLLSQDVTIPVAMAGAIPLSWLLRSQANYRNLSPTRISTGIAPSKSGSLIMRATVEEPVCLGTFPLF